MDARFSAQSAVEECLESAIFKAKPLSPPRPAKVKVTVTTPGSRAFPLAVNDVHEVAAASNRGAAAVPSKAFAAAIGRLAGGFTFPAAMFTGSASGDEPLRASLEVFRPIDEDSVMLADPPPPAMSAESFRGHDLVLRAPAVTAAALATDEEAMSDASSDLFDLESFAALSSYPTTTYQPAQLRRHRPPAPSRRGAGTERVRHVRAERGQRGVERGHGRGRRVPCRQLHQRHVRVRRKRPRGVPLRRPARVFGGVHRRPEETRWQRQVLGQLPV
jgi:hypothetical protein